MRKLIFPIILLLVFLISNIVQATPTSPTANNYCAGVSVTAGQGTITINGVAAPWRQIQYRPAHATTYSLICNDNCTNSQVVSGLAAGTYIVKVEQSAFNHATYCQQEYTIVIEDQTIDYCQNISVQGGREHITINGANAPWQKIQYRPAHATTYSLICDDNCSSSQVVSGLAAGTYVVKIEQSAFSHATYCQQEYTVVVEDRNDHCLHADVQGGIGQIIVNGIAAPWQKIQYRPAHTTTYSLICDDDCSTAQVVSGLAAGTYVVRIETSGFSLHSYCQQEYTVVVENQAIDYCFTASVQGGTEQITIHGVNAPWHRISYRPENSSIYVEACNDNCSNSHFLQGLAAGTYIIKIEQSSGGTINYCSQEFSVLVTGKNVAVLHEENTTTENATTHCSDVYIYTQPHKIGISGVNAPHNRIQLKGPSTQDQFLVICENNCYQNYSYIVISNLTPGYYTLITEESDDGVINSCTIEEIIYVDGFSTGNKIIPASPTTSSFVPSTLTLEYKQEADKTTTTKQIPIQTTDSKIDLMVYPNPAQQQLFVDLSVYKESPISIQIINATGTTIKEVSIDKQASPLLEIDLTTSTFGKGVYFLQVQVGENRFFTEKFMIN